MNSGQSKIILKLSPFSRLVRLLGDPSHTSVDPMFLRFIWGKVNTKDEVGRMAGRQKYPGSRLRPVNWTRVNVFLTFGGLHRVSLPARTETDGWKLIVMKFWKWFGQKLFLWIPSGSFQVDSSNQNTERFLNLLIRLIDQLEIVFNLKIK